MVSAVHTDERAVHGHHRAIKALRLSPDFTRSRERALVTGGRSGRLHLLKKGWLFSGMAEKLLHEGEGVVIAAAWEGSLLAWANEAGVKVMDIEREEPVCFVPVPPGVPPLDACPCRLVWENESCLLVAWGSEVRVVTIREKRTGGGTGAGGGGAAAASGSSAAAASPVSAAAAPPGSGSVSIASAAGAPTAESAGAGSAASSGAGNAPVQIKRFGEVTTRFTCRGALVCGIAPFGDDLALLWCVPCDGNTAQLLRMPSADCSALRCRRERTTC